MTRPAPRLHDPALGAVAYQASWRVLAPRCLPWASLSQDERRAWQAAARAVLRDQPPAAQEDR